MMLVKICGLRRTEDISFVNEAGPDYAGFILSGGFKRSIDPGTFLKLKASLDKRIKTVGVFVDEPISEIEKNFPEKPDVIQLHGNEDNDYIKKLRSCFDGEIWKAVRADSAAAIERADRLGADRLLIDSFVKGAVGGTGKTADTQIIKGAKFKTPFMLAGGVSAENVRQLTEGLGAVGVDASSSCETEGIKDRDKILALVRAVREL